MFSEKQRSIFIIINLVFCAYTKQKGFFMEQNQDQGIPAVDRIANGDQLQMYKAVIPYMPKNLQKQCMILIKLMEMNNLISFYNSTVTACASPQRSNSPEELLSELRHYGSEAQNQQIDYLLNLFSALKLYQSYQEI